MIINFINEYKYVNIRDIINLIGKKNDIITNEFQHVPTQIIIPTVNVNAELMHHLAKYPNDMLHLQPRQYEKMVAQLYTSMGFEVTLTPERKDGGLDIYALYRNDIGTVLYIIECKKYKQENKIGVELIRNLYGVLGMDNHGPSAGVIATTSYFTKDARQSVNDSRFEHRIKLQDFKDISNLLSKYYS